MSEEIRFNWIASTLRRNFGNRVFKDRGGCFRIWGFPLISLNRAYYRAIVSFMGVTCNLPGYRAHYGVIV